MVDAVFYAAQYTPPRAPTLSLALSEAWELKQILSHCANDAIWSMTREQSGNGSALYWNDTCARIIHAGQKKKTSIESGGNP